jgi:hypothetical protein
MKNIIVLLIISLSVMFSGCRNSSSKLTEVTEIDPGRYDSTWWNRAPLRMIQTNLREIDAKMDRDKYVQSIVDMSANMVLINVGGIVANYNTSLKYHFKNTFMEGDLISDLVQKLHAKGIRVIGRFDFSKINETFASQKPGWLYKGTDGKIVNYNGQVHTCINGGYQQEYTFEILREVVDKIPLDGIFFNMIGYTTSDYSGVYHGICQCDNCRKRFKDSTGLILPVREDTEDPVFLRYAAFKKNTSDELFNRIGSYIKQLNPNLIICTYTDAGVDLVRSESGSEVESVSEWNYISTDHVKLMLGSYSDKIPSNTTNHFMGIRFRHTAVSPNLSRIRTLENMLNGAMLDFYCVGTLLNQEDRSFIPVLSDLYGFHKWNEKLFTNLEPRSKICLIKGSGDEYRGIIKLLSEEHIQFDIMDNDAPLRSNIPGKLSDYELIILGDVQNLGKPLLDTLDNYVRKGGKILASGFTSINDEIGLPMNRIRLNCLGVDSIIGIYPKSDASYLKISDTDKNQLGSENYKDISLLMMYSGFLKCKLTAGTTGLLKLVPKAMYGPPEKCYYTEITDYPGLITNKFGKGETVFIPWKLGSLYYSKGNHAHRQLFLSAVEKILNYRKMLVTDASPLVEISHMSNRNGAFEWIGMVNHSGQIGQSFREPVTITNTSISFQPVKAVKEIRLMRAGKSLKFKQSGGIIKCIVPEIRDFEMLLCIYK